MPFALSPTPLPPIPHPLMDSFNHNTQTFYLFLHVTMLRKFFAWCLQNRSVNVALVTIYMQNTEKMAMIIYMWVSSILIQM